MKKLSFTVKTIMACALVAAAASCSEKQAAPAPVPVVDGETQAAARSLNIRYINADSLMSGYELARQIAEESQRMMLRYQQQEQQKQQEIQNIANNIAQKQQNNTYLSQASYEADVQNFQNKQNEAGRFLSNQQNQIQNTIAAAQQRLNDSISNCARDFALANGFDAILMSESGVYFNPDLDVTAHLVKALNDRFKKEEKK
ncbi:MAG: OmpH family outer membrane protein [Muribaculaceae bacterium]|nr:OmpH family outer membrane protein [Muribaculaceae bacterium]MDE6135406.1 OmpH family outer membrane protein [Muribaculaceae bacterium]